jgi:hypothetical protein
MTHRRPVLLHLAIRYSLIPMSVTSDVQFDRGRKPGRPPVTNPAQLGVTGQAPLRQIIRQLRRGASSNLILRLSIVHCSISFLTQGSCTRVRAHRVDILEPNKL